MIVPMRTLAEVLALVVILAIILSIWTVWEKKKTKQAAQWPSTRGRVIQSHVVQVPADETTYEARLTYEYAVAGQSFRSKRVSYKSFATPHETVQKYPMGADVQVFYNPVKPGEAVLER